MNLLYFAKKKPQTQKTPHQTNRVFLMYSQKGFCHHRLPFFLINLTFFFFALEHRGGSCTRSDTSVGGMDVTAVLHRDLEASAAQMRLAHGV